MVFVDEEGGGKGEVGVQGAGGGRGEEAGGEREAEGGVEAVGWGDGGCVSLREGVVAGREGEEGWVCEKAVGG